MYVAPVVFNPAYVNPLAVQSDTAAGVAASENGLGGGVVSPDNGLGPGVPPPRSSSAGVAAATAEPAPKALHSYEYDQAHYDMASSGTDAASKQPPDPGMYETPVPLSRSPSDPVALDMNNYVAVGNVPTRSASEVPTFADAMMSDVDA